MYLFKVNQNDVKLRVKTKESICTISAIVNIQNYTHANY